MGDSFFTVFRCSRIERFVEISLVLHKNHLKLMLILLNFQMTPASVMKRYLANGKRFLSDFHRKFSENSLATTMPYNK